jgi:hypothetical protein
MHELDFFWFAKNPDKRYTKHRYVVLGRNNLDDDPGIHQTKLSLEDAKDMARVYNTYATSNANYWLSLRKQNGNEK